MACEALDEVRVANVGQQQQEEESNVRDRFIGSIVVVAGPAGSQLSQQQIISEGRGGVLAASTSLPPPTPTLPALQPSSHNWWRLLNTQTADGSEERS